jgi:hypothetical protein
LTKYIEKISTTIIIYTYVERISTTRFQPQCTDAAHAGAPGILLSLAHRMLAETLGPEWQALDLGEFLEEHANRAGKRRRLF